MAQKSTPYNQIRFTQIPTASGTKKFTVGRSHYPNLGVICFVPKTQYYAFVANPYQTPLESHKKEIRAFMEELQMAYVIRLRNRLGLVKEEEHAFLNFDNLRV